MRLAILPLTLLVYSASSPSTAAGFFSRKWQFGFGGLKWAPWIASAKRSAHISRPEVELKVL